MPVDRRTFCRFITQGAKLVLAGSTVISTGLSAWMYESARQEKIKKTEEALLKNLFCPEGLAPWYALIPANDHPLHPLPEGQDFYPIESEAAASYQDRFSQGATVRKVNGNPWSRPDDNLVFFGSQVSNKHARRYLGKSTKQSPTFKIKNPYGQWQAELHWNIHTPQNAPIRKIIQNSEPWNSRGHRIASVYGNLDSYESIYNPQQQDDYILITRLPRYKQGNQYIIVFAGLHGAGTRATSKIFEQPPSNVLEKIKQKTSGEPFYQAVLKVTVKPDKAGNLMPDDFIFVDACKISPRWV
jgi:hypothetical protein